MKKILHFLGIHDWGKWKITEGTMSGGLFRQPPTKVSAQIRECKLCGLTERKLL